MFRKIVAFLHARAKAALIQPQSEREAVLTGREPPQGNEDDLREPQGCAAPVQTVPANGYPIFDVTIDGWDGTVLQVRCTYTGTDNEEHQVTVCYDAASRQVVSAE